jgi:hypothetical protein
MAVAKVIHLVKRVEAIDREIAELHQLVAGIDAARSYRNPLKIAAEQQINNLVGEKVKLMDLKIENPPEFLTKHVGENIAEPSTQPRIALEALLGGTTSTYVAARQGDAPDETIRIGAQNPLKTFTRMMNVDEILPKSSADQTVRPRRAEKPASRTRADILRDLPPLQY